MSEGFPEAVFEYTGESCAVFFLGKTPMWFLIMVIPQKPFTGSSKSSKCRTIMSSNYPLLPEHIKTLHSGISARFSLRDKYQMYSQKQMKANNLRNAIRITTSTCSRHLVIHLGYLWDPHKSPCFNEMPTKGDSLLISKLTGECCVSCHIHSVKGIESGNPFRTSEMSGSHKVCLMKVSNLLCLEIRIRLLIAISFGLSSFCLSITRENFSNGRDGGDVSNLPLLELPVDDLGSNAREGRTSGLVNFQLRSNGKNLFNHTVGSFSPDSFWRAALIFETFKSLLSKSFEPFGEPESTSLNQLKYFIKTMSFFIQLYCFTAFFIFVLILHRLSLLLRITRRSLGDIKFSSRCYHIFQVRDVMI